MATSIPITIVGSTGLTGSIALSALLASPSSFTVTALTRRANAQTPASTTSTYINRVLDLTAAVTAPEALVTPGGVYVSCLGTTRAAAGGLKEQEAIDHFLNRDLAKRAHADGADTMILVSSTGADVKGWGPYLRMKGALEDDVKAIGFKNTVILRPAAILYSGDRQESRTAEKAAVRLIRGLRWVGLPTTSMGVDADDIGAAIAQLAAKPPQGVSTLYGGDIIALAKEYRQSKTA